MIISERKHPSGVTVRIDNACMVGPEESEKLGEQARDIALGSVRRRIQRERANGRSIDDIVADILRELDGQEVRTA